MYWLFVIYVPASGVGTFPWCCNRIHGQCVRTYRFFRGFHEHFHDLPLGKYELRNVACFAARQPPERASGVFGKMQTIAEAVTGLNIVQSLIFYCF